jgi:hypothetical protein
VFARALARIPIEDRKRTWTVAEIKPTLTPGEREARTRRERDQHGLNTNERQILNKVGTFRVVSAGDLQRQLSESHLPTAPYFCSASLNCVGVSPSCIQTRSSCRSSQLVRAGKTAL